MPIITIIAIIFVISTLTTGNSRYNSNNDKNCNSFYDRYKSSYDDNSINEVKLA